MDQALSIFEALATGLETAGGPTDPREQFWSREDIAAFDAFCKGAPLPTSAGALDLLAVTCQLDWQI